MDFSVSTALDGDIFVIVITGEGGEQAMYAISDKVVDAVKKSKAKKILIDVRQVRGRLSMAYTYFLVGKLPLESQTLKTAIVDLRENESSYSFHELVSVNRGFQTRYFNDMAEAKLWLSSQASNEKIRRETSGRP
jgi:hypothetical protein